MWTEETFANLSPSWRRVTRAVERFAELQRSGDMSVGACRMAFFERILHTADLTKLLLGFMVTVPCGQRNSTLPGRSEDRDEAPPQEEVWRRVRLATGE
jgi:hypothetical protein